MGDGERGRAQGPAMRLAMAIAIAFAVLPATGCSDDRGGAADGGARGGGDGGPSDASSPGGGAADGAPGGDDAAPGDDASSEDPDASAGADAAAATTTITHSADTSVIEAGHAISCNSGAPGYFHTDNRYWRVFDLPAFGIAGPFAVTSVELGIDRAWSADGFQPIDVRLYTLAGSFTLPHLTSIGGVSIDVADQSQSLVEVPVSGVAPAGSVLVLEIHTPSGVADSRGFFLGSNALGQSGPSYLSADECYLAQPTDLATIDAGFADIDWVLSVTGSYFP